MNEVALCANDVLRNDVGLRPMMFASRMMRGFATFLANITSLWNAVEQHHFERSEKHHIAAGEYLATTACGSYYTVF